MGIEHSFPQGNGGSSENLITDVQSVLFFSTQPILRNNLGDSHKAKINITVF
jgi:hypothetical protein